MFDYIFELFDQANKVIKFVIVAFIFLVTTFLVVLLFVSYENSEELHGSKYHGTSGRREISLTKRKTTKKEDNISITEPIEDNTTKTTTMITSVTEPTYNIKNPTTVSTKTSGMRTTSKKEVNTTRKTTKVTTTMAEREVTNDETTYPNALDFWEWNIVNLINDERISSGYPPLQVAVDLRLLAEQAADYWYDHSAEEVQDFVGDYRFYARQIVNANMTASYNYIFDLVKYYTDITTNKNYEYIGVGVIYLDKSLKGMHTHYSVIIFE